MSRDPHHGKLRMPRASEEEEAFYQTAYNYREVEIKITEREIISLINSIPRVEQFSSSDYDTATHLLDLIQKLRDGWHNGTCEIQSR